MSVLDVAVLTQLAADLAPGDLRQVVVVFEQDMRRLGPALAAAGQAGDLAGWHRAAHGMAGSAAAVGAVMLERLARQAMACTALDADAAAGMAAAIDAAATATIQALQLFTASGTSDE